MDGADRPLTTISAKGDPAQLTTSLSYSRAGLVVTSTSSPAPTATGTVVDVQTFAPSGGLVSLSRQGQTLLTRQVDSYGRVASESRPENLMRTFTYDAFDELIGVATQTASNSVTETASLVWNRNGALSKAIDGAQHSTSNSYDRLGRLQSIVNGLGTTSYTYQTGTFLPATISGPASKISNSYDLAGRLVAMSVTDATGRDPAGSRTFEYSALGDITSATLAKPGSPSQTTTLAYDSLRRRVSEMNTQNSIAVNYSYGTSSAVVTLNQGSNTITLERDFDKLRRPLSLQVSGQATAQWQYANGAPASISYFNGTSLSYGYDAIGRIVSETVTRGSIGLTAITRAFGSDNLPHEYTLSIKSTPAVTNLFQTDNSGRLIAEQANAPGLAGLQVSFQNSDVSALLNQNATIYTLDGASNWLARLGLQPLTTTIDGANRYASLNGQDVQNINGGGIQSISAQQFSWDGLNQLTRASNSSNARLWQFDAFGRQIGETDSQGNTRETIWEGNSPLAVLSGGNLTLHAGFAREDIVALATSTGTVSALYHGPDESVFALADGSGNLQQEYSYSGFGNPQVWDASGSVTTSAPASPYLFQGSFYWPDQGLSRMGVRDYSSSLGRFISPDPIGLAGGMNLFAFVDGRPLSQIDPSGTSGQAAQNSTAGIGTLVAGTINGLFQRPPDSGGFGLTNGGYIHFGAGTSGPFEELAGGFGDTVLHGEHSLPVRGLALVGYVAAVIPATVENLGVLAWNGIVGGLHTVKDSLAASLRSDSSTIGLGIAAQGVLRGGTMIMVNALPLMLMQSGSNPVNAEIEAEEAAEAEALYARPSDYRVGMRETVWRMNADSKGRVFDPSTGVQIDPNYPWQMGHLPGYELRKLQDFARVMGLGRGQFRDMFNNPIYYRPELPQMNANHAAEAAFGENYYLQDFLDGTLPANPIPLLRFRF